MSAATVALLTIVRTPKHSCVAERRCDSEQFLPKLTE